MKKRPKHLLTADKIDHKGELFDYIHELQNYLWRVVRIAYPDAVGDVEDWIDPAIGKLQIISDQYIVESTAPAEAKK